MNKFPDKNAIIPLMNGFNLDVLNPSNNNAQNSAVASNNVNNMFEDIASDIEKTPTTGKSYYYTVD